MPFGEQGGSGSEMTGLVPLKTEFPKRRYNQNKTEEEKTHDEFFFKAGFMVLWALLSTVSASGEEVGKIKTIHIVTPPWPDQTNKDGTGLFFDIVRKVYEPVGIKMKYEIVPWKRAEKMIGSNKADAMVDVLRINAVITPKHPMNVIPEYVVFKKERGKKWEGIKSLELGRTAWFRGYDLHKTPHLKGIKLKWIEIDQYATAWKMLEKERIDFYIDVLMDIEKYVKKE